jgi:cytochrome c5
MTRHQRSVALAVPVTTLTFAVALCGMACAWPAAAADAPAATASAAGVTLHSVAVELPFGERTFPGGAAADVVSSNCMACHSAGMVLTQPALSRADWEAEVNKMRTVYKAPIDPADVPAIVAYLAGLKPGP